MDRAQAIEVELPGGFWTSEGRLVNRMQIRPLTGADEEWLQDCPDERPTGVVAAGLLRRCAIDDDIDHLLIADHDYLLLQLRCVTLGNRFGLVATCLRCNSSMDVGFDADEVPLDRHRQRTRRARVSVEDSNGDRQRVVFHLPTVGDINAAIDRVKPEMALLVECVETVNGRRLLSSELESVLDEVMRERLGLEMQKRASAVELGMHLKCPECAHEFDIDVDLVALILEELHYASRQVWPEVNHIAMCYHWSEADILQLPRERRRRYIGLINESVRAVGRQ